MIHEEISAESSSNYPLDPDESQIINDNNIVELGLLLVFILKKIILYCICKCKCNVLFLRNAIFRSELSKREGRYQT
jgi:hypothetical protein